MTTMIERVARALYEADQAGLRNAEQIGMKLVAGAISPWENLHPENHEGYRKRARAAIEALREPTDQMLEDVGCMDGYDFDRIAPDQDHVEWWSAMIDAALKEA